MKPNSSIPDYFDKEGHLTPDSAAMWVDAVVDGKLNELPVVIQKHIEDCIICKQEVIALYDDVYGKSLDKSESEEGRENLAINRFHLSILLRRTKWYGIAAAIVALLVVAAFLFKLIQTPLHEKLFAEYFQPYQDIVTVKGSNDKLMRMAMYYYDRLQYDSAILFYDKILLNDSLNPKPLFYKGNSLLATGFSKEAVFSFTKAIKLNRKPFKQVTEWYLALAYLQAGKTEEAINQLKLVAISNGYYGDKARELLLRLK